MAEDGQLARSAGRSAAAEPTLAELLDPFALEQRLKEARARRAEALARRGTADEPPRRGAVAVDDPPPRRGRRDEPPPRPVAVDEPPLRLTLPAADVRPPRPAATARHGTGFRAAGLFLAGLGLGAAAVALVVVPALREPTAAPDDPPAVQASPASLADATGTLGGAPSAPPFAGSVQSPRPVGLLQPAAEAEPPRAGAPTLFAALPGPSVETAPVPAPAPVETAPEPAPVEAAAPEPEPASPSAAEATAVPALPLPSQVFIHYPASAQAAATTAQQALRDAGVAGVEIVPVRFAIGRSNVRFYHDADGPGAATVATLLAPGLPPEDAPQARDFTDYATPPAPGKVEVWLAGAPAAGASAPRRSAPAAPRAAPAPAPATPAPVATAIPLDILPGPTPPADQAEAVERILVQRAVERLMRQRDGR